MIENHQLEIQRHRKEDAVKERDQVGTDDVVPIVEFYRDNQMMGVAIASQIDRDMALGAIMLGVPGFGADRIIAVLDSHYTTNMTNPATGQRWRPGEMQTACRKITQVHASAVGIASLAKGGVAIGICRRCNEEKMKEPT